MRRTITILTAILALSAITLPAIAGGGHDDKKIDICHYPPGNPDNPQIIEISKNAWDAHESHGDFKIESRQDKKRCKPTTTTTAPTTTIPEETTTTVAETTTTLAPRMVEVCIDETVVAVPWEQDIENKYDVVKTELDAKHCLPKEPTPEIPAGGGLPIIIPSPIDPGTGWVCVGSDNVITEVPRDSNPLVTIWDTPEEAQADCPVALPEVTVEAPIAPSTTVAATVLPFTGPTDTATLLIAGLAALSLGGILVRSARSDG